MASTASSQKRMRDMSLERVIVYGSIAFPLPQKNEFDHTHRWTVYVRGINNEDLGYYIKRVQFKLHESFAQPTRSMPELGQGDHSTPFSHAALDAAPFEVTETGWGEFEIQIKIFFVDANEKPVALFHHLRLYPTEETIMGIHNSVVAERYDEIVFHEPTEFMHEMLTKGRSASVPNKSNDLYRRYMSMERADISRMDDALKRVNDELRSARSRYDKTEAEYQKLSREVNDLEHRRGIRSTSN